MKVCLVTNVYILELTVIHISCPCLVVFKEMRMKWILGIAIAKEGYDVSKQSMRAVKNAQKI
jgi:hypothetical protein